VHGLAREIRDEVRGTVRDLKQELRQAAREIRREQRSETARVATAAPTIIVGTGTTRAWTAACATSWTGPTGPCGGRS
jgi:hypothetical protein